MKRITNRTAKSRAARIAFAITFFPLALIALAPRQSFAQLDADPTNNTMAGANALSLPPGQAISNLATFTGSGDDVDFFAVNLASGHVLLGMTTPLGGLPNHYDSPDTMASVFSAGTPLTFNDDDAADELPGTGQGRGSLFRVLSPGGGLHHIGITGYGDEEFDGATSGGTHVEAGRYALTVGVVDPAVLGGGFVDTDPLNNSTAPPSATVKPDLISLTSNSAKIAVGELLQGDTDFYQLHLVAGQVLSVMTAPLGDLGSTFDRPDTHIALYNSTVASPPQSPSFYTKVLENEDAGNFNEGTLNPDLASDSPFEAFGVYGSAMRARITSTGTYYLGVGTAFGDPATETGRYALLVGVALPEPGTLLLAALALTRVVSSRHRRFGKPQKLWQD